MVEPCGLGMHGGFFGYGWLIQLLIFIAFFAVVWWVIKNNPQTSKVSAEKPIDILKKRLAKGEITSKQFEKLKKEIR